jgi:CDGSH-type Zn-finger protein/uncharacterized Fe-S cluster protein YjdI
MYKRPYLSLGVEMKSKVLEYQGEQLLVRYDVARCFHVGECVRGLPAVFDPQRKPWVVVDAADAEELQEVIRRCPSGALTACTVDGETLTAESENSVHLAVDGPVYLKGNIKLFDADDNLVLTDSRVALCRCGVSNNKPLCDGRHVMSSFAHDGSCEDPHKEKQRPSDGDALEVRILRDGPAILNGKFKLVDSFGDEVFRGNEAAICRCGASQSKPFCDGSHKGIGFSDD